MLRNESSNQGTRSIGVRGNWGLGSHSQHQCLNRLKDRTCKPVIRVRAPAGAFVNKERPGGRGYGRESFRQHRWDRRGGATRRLGGALALPPGGRPRPDAGAAGPRLVRRRRRAARRSTGSPPTRPSPRSREHAGRRRRPPRRRLDRGARRGARGRAPPPTPTPTSPPAPATPSTSGAPTRPRRSTSATSATWRSATRSPRRCASGGARVENRSLICDVGRSMGEAMAGIVASGRADDELGAETAARRATTSSASVTPTTSRAGPRRPRATTAPRTRSPASRRSTTTRPTS